MSKSHCLFMLVLSLIVSVLSFVLELPVWVLVISGWTVGMWTVFLAQAVKEGEK